MLLSGVVGLNIGGYGCYLNIFLFPFQAVKATVSNGSSKIRQQSLNVAEVFSVFPKIDEHLLHYILGGILVVNHRGGKTA